MSTCTHKAFRFQFPHMVCLDCGDILATQREFRLPVYLTQAEYDALPTYDEEQVYMIMRDTPNR